MNSDDHRPLVSIIITNYNYGAFIGQAIRSVFSQDYPNIECVVVDDHSTDNSLEVIDDFQAFYPDLRLLKNEANAGQSISMLNGFEQTHGPFVIFLDADDHLLPGCVETHVSAHLSSRLAVGFTSVDMVQILDLDIVTLTSNGFSNHVRSCRGALPDLLRESAQAPSTRSPPLEPDEIHYVDPVDTIHWPWSPTSGNCFRRDALNLIIYNDGFRTLRSCSDIYLLRAIGVLVGSLLIDRPLAAYRIHGNNDFVRSATLHQIRIFNPKYLVPRSNHAVDLIMTFLIREADFFVERLYAPDLLAQAIITTNRIWPPLPRSRLYLGRLTKLVLDDRHKLRRSLGYRLYASLIVESVFEGWQIKTLVPAVGSFLVVLILTPFLLLLKTIEDRSAPRPQGPRRK